MNTAAHYIGNELELFRHARNWKTYYRKRLSSYIHGHVLEAGAGIGETTLHLLNEQVDTWVCLEPDASLSEKISEKISTGELPPKISVKTGTTEDYTLPSLFDTIVYIDVIEHIEDDRAELRRAAGLLKAGGHLIILVPAHQWLFSPFDKAIGHYRRYNKKLLRQAVPASLKSKELFYLDSLGLLASLTNKLFLKKEYPTAQEVKFWDNLIVPVSKAVDPLILFSTGKSLIGIWQKP
ncbi:MAG: class I SAM-dependent methyltransferase [Bacteroidia bacterium]|nr:class I SAM-dependent methyltransferase [Bacteroidia bacterium]